ncbi:MAG: sulfatase-like hydrolase/transferase [Rhodobacteraceae bacterium]|nr:sulfatase-like hydrolase/transferase [Paracoccaceae bacterium]
MTSNLLIILSDEHQARAMGCAGHPFVQTPNLDALAAQGIRFSNAYTPSPICVPARAALATGRFVHEIRLWDNAMPYIGYPPSWGHALQQKGVAVESIGKLHYRDAADPVGFDQEHLPMQVAGGVGMVWASIREEDKRTAPPGGGRMLGAYIGPGSSPYTEYDAAITQRACQWLQERASTGNKRPWCLFVGLVAPHFPLVVPQSFHDLYPAALLPEVKLHPSTGYRHHPWVAKQKALMDSETQFTSAAERLSARSAYYGLCSWLDYNVGQILKALEQSGLHESTTLVYSSDHGDNVGARGLWGKSNFYQESVQIPMIVAGPELAPGCCETPVSLLDLSKTIAQHFGADIAASPGVRSLYDIAAEPTFSARPIFSEYHAVGAVSGGFMLRKGRWKFNYYVGFAPELFDLVADPEELDDLAGAPAHRATQAHMEAALREICDPEAQSQQAFADQAALIQSYGGREAALKLGAPGATPAPKRLA